MKKPVWGNAVRASGSHSQKEAQRSFSPVPDLVQESRLPGPQRVRVLMYLLVFA